MVEQLRRLDIFSGVGDDALRRLAALGSPGTCAAGEALIVQGASGHDCYLITGGRARVTIGERTVEQVGPGDTVGELAALDGSPRSASVTAIEPLDHITYSPEAFALLTDEVPALRRRMTAALLRRLRRSEAEWSRTATQPEMLLDALHELQDSDDATVAARAREDASDVVRREAAAVPSAPSGRELLTPGEVRVAELVAQGLSNRAIAERLYVSPHTVNSHLRHAFTKLGVNSRVLLAAAVLGRD